MEISQKNSQKNNSDLKDQSNLDSEKNNSKKNDIKLINIQHFMLTYKTWIKKTDLKAFIKGKCQVDDIYIAHETGLDKDDPEYGYQHTHVVVKCTRKKINPAHWFNYMEIHPHIQLIKVTKNKPFQLAINYISNPNKAGGDKECHEFFKKLGVCESIWECETLDEALKKNVKRAGDAPGVIQIFNNKPNDDEQTEFKHKLNKFQEELLERINENKMCSDELTWYYDPKGKGGKTSFGIWLMEQKKAWYIAGGQSQKNLLCAVENAIRGGWNKKYLIVNISRGAKLEHNFYSTIEMIMDGCITTEKYNSRTINFKNRCKVIIFANTPPDKTMLSEGRWDIRQISAIATN